MRHGLMMTAVATVTVPGLVAVFGVLGHGRAAVPGGAVTAPGAALAAPFPVAPPAVGAGARNDVAAGPGAAGMPVTVFSQLTSAQQAAGLRLLDQAASAGLTASYQGTEQLSEPGVDGSVSMVSEVWHQEGGQTVVQTSSGTSSAAVDSATPSAAGSGAPEGVFGVTKSLVALLSRHYVVAYQGAGAALGRPAVIVEVYRYDGSLAARYWLDRQTKLPLRRELFDTSANVISAGSFTQVQFGQAAAAKATPARARADTPAPAAAGARAAWTTAPAARFQSALAAQGWQVPADLPGGLPLYAAAWTQTSSGKVVELEYSDGLYVVSLFVQRGNLTANLPGWQQVTVDGQQAYAAGHSVTWAGLGFVYTMIADAPPQTVTQAVGAFPAGAKAGLLDRLGRGFDRLAHLFNPFG